MMISFIVIGRNEGWRLEKCFYGICSFVEAEKVTDYEVIYVDSQSSDESMALSKAVGNAKTILITGVCNAAIARNIGAKEAQGDVLFFLDGDMELIPGFYKEVIKDGKMVYPFVSGIEKDVLHDSEWKFVTERVRRKYEGGKDSFEVTTGGLFMIEKQLWERAGGMDNRLRRSQDLDLGFRLTKMGYKLCRKSQLWVNHYTREYQMRTDMKTFDKFKALLMRKHLFDMTAQKFLFGVNYTVWFLITSIIMMVAIASFMPLFLYIVVLCYRSLREYKRNNKEVNPLLIMWRQVLADFRFIFYFITFWPNNTELNYEII